MAVVTLLVLVLAGVAFAQEPPQIRTEDGSILVETQKAIKLSAASVEVNLSEGTAFTLRGLHDAVASLQATVAQQQAFIDKVKTSGCSAGDTVTAVGDDGTLSCARSQPVHGSCDGGKVITGVDGTTGEVTCTAFSVQQRVAETCDAGSSIREVNTDGSVSCETPSSSQWQKRVDKTCADGETMTGVNEDGSVSCAAPDATVWQARVTDACNDGESIRSINELGEVVCEQDDDTVYVEDPSQWQKRVVATCPEGQSIRAVKEDGTVTCHTDENYIPSDTEWQRRVSDSCPQGESIRIVAGDGSVTCQQDTNDVYVEDASKWQRRVTASCPSGQSIRVVNEDGTVACQVDQDTPPSPTEWQRRVTAKCNADQSIREVKQDGTVVCEADSDTVYVPDPTKWQARVSGQCLIGHSIRIVHDDGTVTCEQDDDTAPSNTVWQTRITGTCPLGHSIRVVNPDGTVDCEQDDVPSDDVWQKRVAATCPTGQSIRAVKQDGTVTCETDSDTIYVPDATKWQQRVTGACPDGQSIRQVKQDGTVTCYTDKDTPPSASEWQRRVTGTCGSGFSIRVISSTGTVTCEKDDNTVYVEDSTKWQKRVTATCPAGQSIRVIREDGTVACEKDDNYIPSDTVWQKRVTATCPAGNSIRAISSTGTVTCEKDDNTVPSASTWQKRVSGACPSGQSIREVKQDGTVTCYTDKDTVPSASTWQKRVTSTCPAGSSIRAISSTGTVTCETDSDTVPSASTWQKRVSSTCAAGSSIRAISSTGGVTCEVDSTSSGTWQSVISGSCPEGSSIRAVNSDGTVICDPESATPVINKDHRTFVQWGRRTCSSGKLVYSGFAAGSHYQQSGGGVNALCMPPNPEYHPYGYDNGGSNAKLYFTEYETSTNELPNFKPLHNREVPCALCTYSSEQVFMMPGRNDCYGNGNFVKMYDGWLMAAYHTHSHPSRHMCVDRNAQTLDETDSADNNGNLIYPVEIESQPGGSNYAINREVSCSVCAVKQKSDPKSVFVQWGRRACSAGTEIYRGWVGSGWYSHSGSGADQMCMPYSQKTTSGVGTTNNDRARIYQTEYHTSGYGISAFVSLHNREVPCAVCMVTAHVTEMFPGTTQCPSGWSERYDGWLMANHYTYAHTTEYICVDEKAQTATGSSSGNQNGNLLAPTEVQSPPNSNYKQDYELPCAVCSMNKVSGKEFSTFKVWGKKSCPDKRDTSKIYDGWMGGGDYTQNGNGYNHLCMPHQPTYTGLSGYSSGNQNGALVYRTEYQTSGSGIGSLESLHDMDVPCSLCKVASAQVRMIPGTVNCPAGLTVMYAGYLMATQSGQAHPSEFVCIHELPEPYDNQEGYHTNQNGNLLYPVEMPNPPAGPGVGYTRNRETACVVCAVDY